MRRHAPATARNRQPILDVLRRTCRPQASCWKSPAARASTSCISPPPCPASSSSRAIPTATPAPASTTGRATTGLANVRPAVALDAQATAWPVEQADAVLCSNMIHIAPWPAATGLIAGAGRLLSADGLLYLYGPYRRDGRHTAPSNDAFDRDLRRRNPAWGVRDLEAVAACADDERLRRARDRRDAGQQSLADLPAEPDAAMLLAQISDLHVRPAGERYKDVVDSNRMFADAVEHLNRLDPRPDLVLITGDLVDEGLQAEYDSLRALLGRPRAALPADAGQPRRSRDAGAMLSGARLSAGERPQALRHRSPCRAHRGPRHDGAGRPPRRGRRGGPGVARDDARGHARCADRRADASSADRLRHSLSRQVHVPASRNASRP